MRSERTFAFALALIGIGADDCRTALVVEDCAPYGLLVTERIINGSQGTVRIALNVAR